MKVLVACEQSQAVTIQLRRLGHEAFSCDVLPCSGGHPEWHLRQDVTRLLRERWDMILAFPPCTHLAVSGAKHFSKKREDGRQLEAIKFFAQFLTVECDRVAIENPVGIISGKYIQKHFPEVCHDFGLPRKSSQIIQPYQFGDPFQKTTCLWLKGLPKLRPTRIVDRGEMQVLKSGKVLPKWYSNCGNRKINRSKTFPGIAKAMAEQWSLI